MYSILIAILIAIFLLGMQAVPCYTLLQRIEEYTEDEHEDLIIPIASISAVDAKVEGPSAPWLIDELPAPAPKCPKKLGKWR